MNTLNLDQLAAQYAQKIVKDGGADIENLITKTLGILQEQGVYACIVFLLANKDDKILPQLYDLLKVLPAFKTNANVPTKSAKPEKSLEFYSDDVCHDLDTLLQVKELYEQTLIYARYGAKAADK